MPETLGTAPGALGCDQPGHPQNYAHDCPEWDVALAIWARWNDGDKGSEDHA